MQDILNPGSVQIRRGGDATVIDQREAVCQFIDGSCHAVAAHAAQLDEIRTGGKDDEEAPVVAQDALEFARIHPRRDRHDDRERAVGIRHEAVRIGHDPLASRVAPGRRINRRSRDVDAMRQEAGPPRGGAAYTFVVMAVLIAVLGGIAIASMPEDVFPYIDIPVVSVVWTYSGISPSEMAARITTVSERAFTTTVNDIEHMESGSYYGTAIIRIFFQPNAKIDLAVAQVTAICQTILKAIPPGSFPPNILKYDASSVPILQMGLSSKTLSEQEIYDLGRNFIRTQLATVQGAAVPFPYGGKSRQIMVDLDPDALYAKGLSATDISNAVSLQNLLLPAGTAKMGDRDYFVTMNSSPLTIQALNDLPVRSADGAVVYIRDVAQVHDGFAVQTNVSRHNGQRGALLTVLKNGQASTVDMVEQSKGRYARHPGRASPWTRRQAAVRPEPICDRRYKWRGARGAHSRGSYRAHDSAVSRQLAQHGDRLYFDSPFDSHFLHRAVGLWLHDQCHDAGRNGSGGRHPGGRRHRRNRKRAQEHGHGEAHYPQPFWMARSRSRCRPSFPPLPSASSSFRSCS